MTNADIVKTYGCDARTIRRVREAGRAIGDMPPWDEGQSAMIDWHVRVGRKLPAWLRDAGVPAVPAPEVPAITVDGEALEADSVEVMDSLIVAYSQQIEAMKKQGIKGAALASMGKDYAKLCIARDKMNAERRKYDDNLIDKARVITAIERLMMPIPGRFQDELLAAEGDAVAASAAGKFREWTESFCRAAFSALGASFGEHLKSSAA